METFYIILGSIIILLILGCILYGWKLGNDNYQISRQSVLFPFSMRINPTQTASVADLVDKENNPQIQCPSGYEINIVSANFEVMDPYGTCSDTPFQVYKTSCGDNSGYGGCIKKGEDNTCNDPEMECDEGSNLCIMKKFGGEDEFFENPNTGRAAIKKVCENIDLGTYTNKICGAKSGFNCIARDASAYLAAKCNGQQICKATVSNEYFGPWPCNLDPTKNGGVDCSDSKNTSDYCKLPYSSGWGGGPPQSSKENQDPNFNTGYYVHGLYTCVLKK